MTLCLHTSGVPSTLLWPTVFTVVTVFYLLYYSQTLIHYNDILLTNMCAYSNTIIIVIRPTIFKER